MVHVAILRFISAVQEILNLDFHQKLLVCLKSQLDKREFESPLGYHETVVRAGFKFSVFTLHYLPFIQNVNS